MLTLLNLGIILMLLIMIAIWATYGFFSAFIQLVIIIASGVLALALWEPISYMLLGRMPAYAHGVGLLVPFVLLLIILRTAFDKLCRANVHMPRIADQIGGGACGLLSGILAIGLLLNGANFLPMHREVMGWEPYIVDGNEVNDNDEGTDLWVAVHKWSAGFFNTISTGSMRPTGGTPLAEGRPDLARRALLTRLPADENQFRTAHPGSVQVTGVYAMPATQEAIYGLAQRSAILAFLSPSYELPEYEYGENGMGMVQAIYNELNQRYADPSKGRPSQMLNIQAILEVSRVPQYQFTAATSQQGFPRFVQMVAEKMGADMVKRLGSTMGENKVLYIVDTDWNNEYPGTYNSDGKLRVAIPQVSLMVGGEPVAPIGYSIRYNKFTGGRIFTEIISDQADASLTNAAYSKYTETEIGWVFALSADDVPDRFFVRELRFDLDELDKPEGQDTRENRNPGAVAHVIGAPLLPSAADVEKEQEQGNETPKDGVRIAGTNIYAEVSERLPATFGAAASSMKLDKDADPWELISGKAEKMRAGGGGGNTSTVREISVRASDRLVRIEMDPQKAKSLLGRAVQAAENLTILKVIDDAGNVYDSIGFALLRSDRTMYIDIREDAFNRGVSAGELPKVGPEETLMVYFQVPHGTKLKSLIIGGEAGRKDFEATLEVKKAGG